MEKGLECFRCNIGSQKYYAYGEGLGTMVSAEITENRNGIVTVELQFREQESMFFKMKEKDFNEVTSVYFHDQYDMTISFNNKKSLYLPHLWYGETYECFCESNNTLLFKDLD